VTKLNEITDAVEKLTTTVEKAHQEIARMPIDIVESIAPGLPLTKTVAEVQAQIIGGVYNVIRGVTKVIGDMPLAQSRPSEKPTQAEPAKAAP
jgi:hypothetical protein